MHSEKKDRREDILEVAEEAFASKGFKSVGIREIASKAGIHSATLYHYFASKEALYLAVIERTFRDATRWIEEGTASSDLDPTQRLVNLITRHFEFMAQHHNYLKILLHELQNGGPLLPLIVQRYMKPLLESLVSILDEIQKEGGLRPLDVREALFSIMAINVSYFLFVPLLRHLLDIKDPLSPEALAYRRDVNLEILLNGLLNPLRRLEGEKAHP